MYSVEGLLTKFFGQISDLLQTWPVQLTLSKCTDHIITYSTVFPLISVEITLNTS